MFWVVSRVLHLVTKGLLKSTESLNIAFLCNGVAIELLGYIGWLLLLRC